MIEHKTEKEMKIRLNLQINPEIEQMVKVLREKHSINFSSFCRNAIIDLYKKLEQK